MEKILKDLQDGVVLTELAGYTDGSFCASNGRGAPLVMMGTYIVDSSTSIDYPAGFIFKPGHKNYSVYLKENIQEAKTNGSRVGTSVVSVELSDTIDFMLASQDAGADLVSLCAHSTMEIFIKNDVSSALLLKKNWGELSKWIKSIIDVIKIPVIFKIGAFDNPDIFDAVRRIKDEGISMIHLNIESCIKGSKGTRFLKELDKKDLFLIAGGGIKDLKDALIVLKAGADAVSIGTAAIKDPDICGGIQKSLNNIQRRSIF